ncbi:MAG TPA: CPBP family intramembrane glutamic endopeptidase [Acidobacteriota bacterium]|nr:CPBP family intramembrane glutamic endopeptidase [Acidobacteriota bacterium]
MEAAKPVSLTKPHWRSARWLSAIELLLGIAVVIGHNVYHIVPSEVIVLFVAGAISVRVREGRFSAIGLRRPSSWLRIIAIAIVATATRLLLGELVIDPWTARFWPPAAAPSGTDSIAGNAAQALKWLAIVWTYAAFGEEFVYRRYLLTRTADLGMRSALAYSIGLIVTSVLFGYGHYYKGPSGIIDSGAAGFIFGAAYLLSGRNLWAPILAHGFVDTLGVGMLFLGLDS